MKGGKTSKMGKTALFDSIKKFSIFWRENVMKRFVSLCIGMRVNVSISNWL